MFLVFSIVRASFSYMAAQNTQTSGDKEVEEEVKIIDPPCASSLHTTPTPAAFTTGAKMEASPNISPILFR
jgi:hypothetical protein